MFLLRIDFDDFLSWLASHATDESVGRPGLRFNSPLAGFLSWRAGCVVGEDGRHYGRAALEDHHWLVLPAWAQLFASLSERACFGRSLSAYDALSFLVQVETALSSACTLLA